MKTIIFLIMIVISGVISASEKPNVIFILADDASPRYYNKAVTPNLDYMASRGIKFNKAYAASICAASRHLLMTGKFAGETGAYHNTVNSYLDNDVNHHLTLAKMFKDSGYKTGYFGKWGVDGDPENYDETVIWEPSYLEEGLENPFTGSRYWHPSIIKNDIPLNTEEYHYGPDIFVDEILNFMESNKNIPYTVHYGMVDPHAARGHDWPKMPDRSSAPNNKKSRYIDTIRYGDVLLGKIIKKAEESNKPFIIIFASDNATANEGKQESTVNGCHVVFTVYGNNIKYRGTTNSLISFADVLPTLATFAGYGKRIYCDGVDLSAFWKGDYHFTRKYVYSNIGASNIYIDKKYSIESRDFVRKNRSGDFYKGRRQVSKNRIYRKLIKYGNYVNGRPINKSHYIFKSNQGRKFLKFWINLDNSKK